VLERFHKSRALCSAAEGGFFLRKKPIEGSGLGVPQLCDPCSSELRMCWRPGAAPANRLYCLELALWFFPLELPSLFLSPAWPR
jgi:hypothetical protein